MAEIHFDKYQKRGSIHWREMTSRDIRRFNAFQQARYDWILKMAGDIQGKKVLDLGCGDGALTYLLACAGAVVVGVDNEEDGLRFARENLRMKNKNYRLKYEFVLASAYELPFSGGTFDLVTNCEVIEHLQDPERMLSEIKRVLKEDGKFIFTTPYRLRQIPADSNHVKEYFPEEIEQMLKKYFSAIQIKLTHHVFWYGLFIYAFRRFGNRQFGRWFLNALTLWFHYNPFLIDYRKPTKQDLFTEILAVAVKTNL